MNKAIKLISSLSLLTILSIPTHKLQVNNNQGLNLVETLEDNIVTYDIAKVKGKKEAVRASTNEVNVSDVKIQQKQETNGTYTLRFLAGISDYTLASKAYFDVTYAGNAKFNLPTTKTYSSIVVGTETYTSQSLFSTDAFVAVKLTGLSIEHINSVFQVACHLENDVAANVGESAKKVAFKPATIIEEDNLANHNDLSGIDGTIGDLFGLGEGFGEEKDAVNNPNKITYWNSRDWGAGYVNVISQSYKKYNGHNYSIGFKGTATEFWAVQIFARLPNLNAYGYDKLTMYVTIDSSVDGTITLNGFPVDVIKGKNIISSKLTKNGFDMANKAHFVVQFGVDNRPETYMNEGEFTFSNIRVFENTSLVSTRNEKIASLQSFDTPDAYTPENYKLVKSYIDKGVAAIMSATSLEAINEAYNKYKALIDQVERVKPLFTKLTFISSDRYLNDHVGIVFGGQYKDKDEKIMESLKVSVYRDDGTRLVKSNAARAIEMFNFGAVDTKVNIHCNDVGPLQYISQYIEIEFTCNEMVYKLTVHLENHISNNVATQVDELPNIPVETSSGTNTSERFIAVVNPETMAYRLYATTKYKDQSENDGAEWLKEYGAKGVSVQAGKCVVVIERYGAVYNYVYAVENYDNGSKFASTAVGDNQQGIRCNETGTYDFYFKFYYQNGKPNINRTAVYVG